MLQVEPALGTVDLKGEPHLTMRYRTAPLLLIATAALLAGCLSSVFEPPQRLGPPGMVMHGGVERLWLLVKQEEQKYVGSSSRRDMATRWETFYHFELRAHDPETAQLVWKKRLGTVHENRGGHSAQARIIGPDGDAVWLFLDGQPLALSAADGTVIADRARIEQVNPALKGLIPKDLKFYAFDGGLVITAADARRFRVNATDYRAVSYAVKDEQAFARLAYMTHTWNGGYQTKDFLVRQGMLDGRWIGLHTEAEAADVGDDRYGDHLKNPDRARDEGAFARRALWTARIGKTGGRITGQQDRLTDLARVPGTAEFLQGGFMIRRGTRVPLQLKNPDGVLVLHRTRVDAEGRLALTRLDGNFRDHWRAVLPVTEIRNRWEWPDRLLLTGAVQVAERGVTRWQDMIVAVNLRDGRLQAWNVTLERAQDMAKARDGTSDAQK